MNWIYLSPHFDDAVYSCGGLIWEQTSKGESVQIWTICAGDIPQGDLSQFAEAHHLRWETGPDAVTLRRIEDQRSCEIVSASFHYFPLPDCIYRRASTDYWAAARDNDSIPKNRGEHLYTSNEALFGTLHPAEIGLIRQLSNKFAEQLLPDAELVCPLTIGGHVDHRLTRLAAERLGRKLWYYADIPYAFSYMKDMNIFIEPGWRKVLFKLSPTGLQKWGEAIAMHGSQVSTFWRDVEAMQREIQGYAQKLSGAVLWRPKLD